MRLPHLQPFARDPLYFLTACIADRLPLLACEKAFNILSETWRSSIDHDGWHVGRFLLMPDHVHLFARPARDARRLADWIKAWKSISARKLSLMLEIHPPIWQRDYFDHFVRSADSYSEKWEYVLNNPVRKKLVATPSEWRWQGVIEDLSF